MKHLFCPEGKAALAAAMRARPLLAFDFDGTLAPIVPRPADAQVPMAVAHRLQRLGRRLQIAIITGRRVQDVRGRLHFEPAHIIGNHGAEDPAAGLDDTPAQAALQGFRARLAAAGAALQQAGVDVEDKGASIALHYRLARDSSQAVAALAAVLQDLPPALRAFQGKRVVNVVWAAANDKALALAALVAREGADAAVFVGDDVNDEPVFERDEPRWLTVRVGHDGGTSRARYFLHAPAEIPAMLDAMLLALPAL